MTRSLRRSRRATKKISDYNVGDVVEINRGDSVVNGRLAQLLTEGSSPNPRWLVNLIGQNKHEEMYEKSFGKLISQAEDDAMLNNPATSSSSPPSSAQRRSTKPNGGGVTNKKGSNGKNSGTSSEGEGGDDSKVARSSRHANSKKSVSFTDGSQGGSDASSTPEAGAEMKMSGLDKVSAREQRSRRRQAKIDEETVPAALGEVPNIKRRIPPPPNHAKKRQRHSDDGEVVKVKLLTGTLYLYRGQHRRVEFIRRV